MRAGDSVLRTTLDATHLGMEAECAENALVQGGLRAFVVHQVAFINEIV